ncbi:T9SS type A sorting domain-containing protein [Gaetbulibacter saemankumensis]|uniref:T9SS type A sorting domain-containing protein n=1 Tax=Gaetbulibacter saemankumensis TaxID=311208 RepID=UPI000489999B|nr:T9SS type A sorting domain-containing protein [Gaetbulibacter saemankumensis]
MKNFYLSFLLTLSVLLGFAQNNDFTNNGGDALWSNSANWSLGEVPNTTNTGIVRLPLIVESQVDLDVTIKKIQTTFNTSGGDAPVAGASTLTLDPNANAVYGIENVSGNDISIVFKGNVTINNSTTAGISNTLMRNANGSGNSIIFADGSLLTLNTPLEARNGSNNNFSFNGSLAGTSALRFNGNTISTFGATSDNTGYEGDFVWVGQNASVIVNSADNNVFLPSGRKIQINAINGSIEVNGANVFQGNISINGSNTFTFNVDNNQNNMGFISFSGGTANGTLNLDIDGSVVELAFADTSAADWNAGTLNITNFTEGIIRFGTDSNGLTSTQLSQINIVGGTGPVALNSSGYLVYESSLSTNDFEQKADKRISYPSVTTEKLTFSKPQEDVKIFDINGKIIRENESKNQTQIKINTLSKGIYFIVFDNLKVEKFIKQ